MEAKKIKTGQSPDTITQLSQVAEFLEDMSCYLVAKNILTGLLELQKEDSLQLSHTLAQLASVAYKNGISL